MKSTFKKIAHILKETFYLVREHKLYFLAPLFLMLAVLAILFFHMSPGVLVTFIYAGL